MAKYALILNGEWFATYSTMEQAEKARERIQEASDNEPDFIRYYGAFPSVDIKQIED